MIYIKIKLQAPSSVSYFLFFDNEGDLFEGTLEIQAKQVSLFPILPSISWNFAF